MSTQSTGDRILEAAIQLISEKGYAAATTRSIAELAGVNEVTIFRHFGNKHGILQAIVRKFSYGPILQKTIQLEVTYELEEDLLRFAHEYLRYMLSIKDFVMIAFKEAGAFPEIDEEIAQVPRFIKGELMAYFAEMKRRKLMADLDEEAVAMSFIALNFGHFISTARFESKVTEKKIEELLKTSITIFSRGITP
ncbi:TetR/AcrR family transcriptional regulator [Bacillus sp. OxB-1]|uniref:TetR/AcrR family transcriptional regulator n=1 Tax=Bacillus sp. (strain OxB-1) TaxID=98228 RepID=UPI000581DB7A|nr:TetR/AcrR family transcriptional regulator [Bacillus sp. OxB-1]BAQ09617.1 TetR/AcrR family transcriptional regulator [Bacillus sp. OxB-1]